MNNFQLTVDGVDFEVNNLILEHTSSYEHYNATANIGGVPYTALVIGAYLFDNYNLEAETEEDRIAQSEAAKAIARTIIRNNQLV